MIDDVAARFDFVLQAVAEFHLLDLDVVVGLEVAEEAIRHMEVTRQP